MIATEYSIIKNNFEDEDCFLKIKLRDDINCEYGREFEISAYELTGTTFTYANNPSIKIGKAHCCAYMIYLGCVGDDCGGENGPIDIHENTLNDLFEWKRKLIDEDRLLSTANLKLIKNCCS